MQIEMEFPAFGTEGITGYAIRFFNASTNALVKEASTANNQWSLVSGSSPARYRSVALNTKPSVPTDGTSFYVKVAPKNAIGVGTESTASAVFSMAVPSSVPANVTVLNPES